MMKMKNKYGEDFSIKQVMGEKIIYLVLILLIIVVIMIEPKFLSFANLKNICAQSSTKIIIALAAGMVLMVRGCDLSTGRMIGLAAVVSASMMQQVDYAYRMYPNLKELPLIVPIVVVIVICIILGSLTGITVALLKVPPIIATLAMQLILYGASSIYFDRPPYGAQPIGGISSKIIKCSSGSILSSLIVPRLSIILYGSLFTLKIS